MSCSRVAAIKQKYITLHSREPDFVVRAPGRVNLIGEHIDYMGYGVLPMAIDHDIIIAAGKAEEDEKLHLSNISEAYPDFTCDINNFSIDGSKPLWHKYVLCGVKGIAESDLVKGKLHGLNFVVGGNVPPAAGLSSSSALVCSGALATANAHNCQTDPHILANLCAKAERYIGTEGGGMDQAACFLSQKGTAQLIEFDPLKCTKVVLPDGYSFVVANSLAMANKAATSNYNCRVMECRLAAKIISLKCGFKAEEVKNVTKLGYGTQGIALHTTLGYSFDKMIELVNTHLHTAPYSQKEICSTLNISVDQLKSEILSKNTAEMQEFHLHDRALHVYSEAHRVILFKQLCDSLCNDDSDKQNVDNVSNKLGEIMYESHESTKNLYCCSHPKLDALVDISKGMALGARLTGAGWGGCIVAMVSHDKLEEYKNKLVTEFYDHEETAKGKDINEIMFEVLPADSARVIETTLLFNL